MRPMIIKKLLDYQFPSPEDISILGGVNPKPLSLDKLLHLASLPYRDDRFFEFAYSVSYRSLRSYTDEGYLDLVKLLRFDSRNKTRQISDSPIGNLIIQTNLETPLYKVREMKWLKGYDFLGSYGIYTIHSKFGFKGDLMQRVASQVAQYSLESCNTFERLLIGVIQPDNSWQLVMVNMGINSVNMQEGNNTITVTILIYDPTDFVRMVAGILKHQDVPIQKLVSYVKVARSLEHFKPLKNSSEKVTLVEASLPSEVSTKMHNYC